MASDGERRKGLTANQKRFVEEFVIDSNRVLAYLRAFGRENSKGQRRSYFVAAECARRLLEKPAIQAEVEAARREMSRRCRLSADRVLRGLIMQAFVDPADVHTTDADGQMAPLPIHKIPPHVRQQIESVEIERRRLKGDGGELYEIEKVKYKFASKTEARKELCKHLGITKDGAGLDALLQLLGSTQQRANTPPPGERPADGGPSVGGDADPAQI